MSITLGKRSLRLPKLLLFLRGECIKIAAWIRCRRELPRTFGDFWYANRQFKTAEVFLNMSSRVPLCPAVPPSSYSKIMPSGAAAEYGGVIVRKCERNRKREQRTLKQAQIEAQEFVEQENNGKPKRPKQCSYTYITGKEKRKYRESVNTGS